MTSSTTESEKSLSPAPKRAMGGSSSAAFPPDDKRSSSEVKSQKDGQQKPRKVGYLVKVVSHFFILFQFLFFPFFFSFFLISFLTERSCQEKLEQSLFHFTR